MNPVLEIVLKHDLPMIANNPGRNLFMPGDGRYQSESLKPFLGYDMWASFLVLVEWSWLMVLGSIGQIPNRERLLLTRERLLRLLERITTTEQDAVEKTTKHDILALLQLMRQELPKSLHRYLHLGATSYDIICTAYALILNQAFTRIFWPKLREIDVLWREKIEQYARVLQTGRTHLQTALPVTVGFWLAGLHHQFVESAKNAYRLADLVPGKFTGAVGTSAALKTMLGGNERWAERMLMNHLGLKPAEYSTQITPPQAAARFYFELVLLSGVLGNLGEDVRILQSSQFGEIVSVGSSSSTMAHKKANPIAAENLCGMHVNVSAEFTKVMMTLVSDLQRDLRWSSVMRSFSAIMVYGYQQLLTAERLLKSLAVNQDQLNRNFHREAYLVMAELLHLCLQKQGYPRTHQLVNQDLVPTAAVSGKSLVDALQNYVTRQPDQRLEKSFKAIPAHIIHLLESPEMYTGRAAELAEAEAENKLTKPRP